MKIHKILIPLICSTLFACTSTEMSLKRLDQDIPSRLVEKYNSSTDAYVDKGEGFFPILLLSGNKHVAKTQSGFEAYQNNNLGIVLVDLTRSAQFNDQGRLLNYKWEHSLFTPLVYSHSYAEKINGENIKTEHSWRFLSFGYEEKISGQKSLSALWIPIPINKVDVKETN